MVRKKKFESFKRLVILSLALLVVVTTMNTSALANQEEGALEAAASTQVNVEQDTLQIPGHISARDREVVQELGVVPWFLNQSPIAALSIGPPQTPDVGTVFWQLSTNQVPYPVPTGPAGDFIDITFRLMVQTAQGPQPFTGPLGSVQLTLDFPVNNLGTPQVSRALNLAPEVAPHPVPNIRWGQQMINEIPGLGPGNMNITFGDFVVAPPQGNTSMISFWIDGLVTVDNSDPANPVYVDYEGVVEFTARFLVGSGFIPNPGNTFRLGVFRPPLLGIIPGHNIFQTHIIRVCPCDDPCLECEDCMICEVPPCPCDSGYCVYCCEECDGIVVPGPDRDTTLPPRNPGANFAIQWVPFFDFGRHQLGTITTFNVLPATHPTLTVDDGAGNQIPAQLRDGNHFVSVNNLVAADPGPPIVPSPGWRVTVDLSSQFYLRDAAGAPVMPLHYLTNASILFDRAVIATGFDGGPGAPTNVVMTNLPAHLGQAGRVISPTGPAVLVAAANAGQAEGQIALEMGQGPHIQLRAPDRASHREGRFTATMDWVLTVGPGM